MISTIPPQEASVASSTFGVTSSASASGKKEQETLLSTIPDMPRQQQEDDEDPHDTMITFLTGRTKSERSSKERAIIFPVKLMYVLQCGKYTDIVNWQLDSEHNEHHFIVQDIEEFTKQVLPIFFKVAKYESFQRKLYRWGFIKTRRTRAEKMKSPKSVCYVHPCFRQGDYNGAAQMTCSGASVEICKSTQKHRKRQQRQKGSKDRNSKRQRTSASTAATKNEDLDQQQQQQMLMMMQQQPAAAAVLPSMQNSTALTAMPGLNMQMQPSNSFLSFPHNSNMFMMMNALPSNDSNALQHMMPVLANTTATMPSTSNILGNERIQDDSFATIISRDSSSLNTTDSCNAMMSKQTSSSTTSTSRPAEDNIPELLARARTQREIKRIQMNNLMREEMLRELQTDSPGVDGLPAMDWAAGTDVNMHTTTDAPGGNTSSAADNLMEQDNSNGNLLQFNQALNSGSMYNAMSMDSNNMNYPSFDNNNRNMHQQIINDAFNALMRSS